MRSGYEEDDVRGGGDCLKFIRRYVALVEQVKCVDRRM